MTVQPEPMPLALEADDAAGQTRLLVDGHVHVHPTFNESRFLAAVFRNFSSHGTGIPVLLLAEMPDADVFRRWRGGDAPARVTPTAEAESLWLDDRLLVVAGQQLVTAERIEVLSLLTPARLQQDQDLETTLHCVEDAGGTAVLPWGVGKWLGRRGRIVAASADRQRPFLGDNAGRPYGWPRPRLFQHHRVLPGTDPLKLKAAESDAGRFVFALDCPLDRAYPARSLRTALRSMRGSPPALGVRSGPVRFLQRQIAIRLKR